MMKIIIRYYFALFCFCIAIAGCSDEQTDGTIPSKNNWGAKERIDSIVWRPEDPAVFKFDYNLENKVKAYKIETARSNIAGPDSVTFDYLPEKITARMSFLKETSWGGLVKQKTTGTFYLHDGKIVCASLPICDTELIRDSIIYHYDGDKLSNYEVYEVNIRNTESPGTLCYVQNFSWNNDDLVSMSAIKDSETIYETSFTYNTNTLTALLPYMSFEYLLDSNRTYISVLANMGFFGVLPKHELTEIVVTRKETDYRYQVQIDYHYGTDGLPLTYDFHHTEWYYGLPFFAGQDGDKQWNIAKSQSSNGIKVIWCH